VERGNQQNGQAGKPEFDEELTLRKPDAVAGFSLDVKIQRQKKYSIFNALKRCLKVLIFDWNLSFCRQPVTPGQYFRYREFYGLYRQNRSTTPIFRVPLLEVCDLAVAGSSTGFSRAVRGSTDAKSAKAKAKAKSAAVAGAVGGWIFRRLRGHGRAERRRVRPPAGHRK
jgi:hypothetical protein